jgi:hypothetical protein
MKELFGDIEAALSDAPRVIMDCLWVEAADAARAASLKDFVGGVLHNVSALGFDPRRDVQVWETTRLPPSCVLCGAPRA